MACGNYGFTKSKRHYSKRRGACTRRSSRRSAGASSSASRSPQDSRPVSASRYGRLKRGGLSDEQEQDIQLSLPVPARPRLLFLPAPRLCGGQHQGYTRRNGDAQKRWGVSGQTKTPACGARRGSIREMLSGSLTFYQTNRGNATHEEIRADHDRQGHERP